MQFTTTVTQKGQVTLPKVLRDEYGIEKYQKVVIERGKDHLIVRPVSDILELAGTVVPIKKKSIDKARIEFEKKYTRV